MQICVKCRKEMICIKTGAKFTWNDGCHAYSGDVYRCKSCGNQTANCNNHNYQIHPDNVPEVKASLGEWFVEMDK